MRNFDNPYDGYKQDTPTRHFNFTSTKRYAYGMNEKQELDFIDWVVLPFCIALLIPVAILAVVFNLWDHFRKRQ